MLNNLTLTTVSFFKIIYFIWNLSPIARPSRLAIYTSFPWWPANVSFFWLCFFSKTFFKKASFKSSVISPSQAHFGKFCIHRKSTCSQERLQHLLKLFSLSLCFLLTKVTILWGFKMFCYFVFDYSVYVDAAMGRYVTPNVKFVYRADERIE